MKDWYRNFPNHFWIRASAEPIRSTNICLLSNESTPGYMLRILSSKCNLSLALITHSVTKCSSSSTTLHSLHNRRWDGTFGLVYLPRSISKIWELARSFDIADRYLTSLTLYRYDSVPKSNLNRQYVLNNGLWSTFNSLYHLLIKSLITCQRQCLLNSFTLPPPLLHPENPPYLRSLTPKF